MADKQVRAQYTQEFKLEAVRQVRAGQAISVIAKVLGIPKPAWVTGCVRPVVGKLQACQPSLKR